MCILTNKVFRGLEILVEAVGFDVVGDQLADPVLVRELVRVGPRLNLHLLYFQSVLRIRDVYPGFEFFPSRIQKKIPDPGSGFTSKDLSIL